MRFARALTTAVVAMSFVAAYSHAAVVTAGQQGENNFLQEDSQRAGRAVEYAAAQPQNGNMAMLTRIANECSSQDMSTCLAVKAATALERAARSVGDVQLFPGLSVVKNEEAPSTLRDSRSLPTEEELRGQLAMQQPENEDDRVAKVTDMVLKSAVRFFQSRTLKFNFPQTDADELARSIEEGRAKLKKKVLPILGLLAVKILAVLPILLGIIGFFALKALLFGKLALLIAGVMAFQKYAGQSAGFSKITDPWGTANAAPAWSSPAAPSTNGGYYRRSMQEAAQQLAYNGQMQPSAQTIA